MPGSRFMPSTEAARSRYLWAGVSRSIRDAMIASIVSGIASPSRSESIPAAISVRKSGLPSARSTSAAIRWAGTCRSPMANASRSSAASGARGSSSSEVVWAAEDSCQSAVGSRVATISQGRDGVSAVSRSSRSVVASSMNWTSLNTRRVGSAKSAPSTSLVVASRATLRTSGSIASTSGVVATSTPATAHTRGRSGSR